MLLIVENLSKRLEKHEARIVLERSNYSIFGPKFDERLVRRVKLVVVSKSCNFSLKESLKSVCDKKKIKLVVFDKQLQVFFSTPITMILFGH